jgi:hypothetical protein
MPKSEKKPRTLVLLTCEKVKISGDDVESLYRLIQGRAIEQMPFEMVEDLYVYWEAERIALGTHKCYVVITNDDDGSEIARSKEWLIESSGQFETISKCARFQDLVFPSHGIYWVRIVYGNKTVARRSFTIAPWDDDEDDQD